LTDKKTPARGKNTSTLSLGVSAFSPFSSALVLYKTCGDLLTDRRLFLDLVFCPNTELQYVLELLGQVVPPVVVAQCRFWI